MNLFEATKCEEGPLNLFDNQEPLFPDPRPDIPFAYDDEVTVDLGVVRGTVWSCTPTNAIIRWKINNTVNATEVPVSMVSRYIPPAKLYEAVERVEQLEQLISGTQVTTVYGQVFVKDIGHNWLRLNQANRHRFTSSEVLRNSPVVTFIPTSASAEVSEE